MKRRELAKDEERSREATLKNPLGSEEATILRGKGDVRKKSTSRARIGGDPGGRSGGKTKAWKDGKKEFYTDQGEAYQRGGTLKIKSNYPQRTA